MFGRHRPIVFDPYRRRGARRWLPRWLVLLLLGLAVGAAGVVYVQERHLPRRLSAAESAQLRRDHDQAEAERKRLESELAGATRDLQAALAERDRANEGASAGRGLVQRLGTDLAFAVDALPRDPRDGQVAVRAARLTVQRGQLDYRLALSHRRSGDAPLAAVLQFVATGSGGTGGERAVSLQPVKLALDRQSVASGSVPLPEGFKPRLVSVRVLDRVGGAQLGLRVLNVD